MKPDLLVSLAVALLLSAGGWAARALTFSGAVAATTVGFAILLGAGWPGAAVLGAFFILGSAIGRILRSGDIRSVMRRVSAAMPGRSWPTAAAPRWARRSPPDVPASPCGSSPAASRRPAPTPGPRPPVRMSRTPPRLLLVGRVVPAGTNGGMTLLGSAGAVVGAVPHQRSGRRCRREPAPRALGNGDRHRWHGARLDSRGYAAGTISLSVVPASTASDRTHRCGTPTVRTGGVSWLTNDGVNAVTTAAGALAGLVAWRCASSA